MATMNMPDGRHGQVATPTVNLIPGAGVLGMGIDVTVARDWGDETALLVELAEQEGQLYNEPPTGPNQTTYLLPNNVRVDDIWRTKITYDVYSSRQEYASAMAAQAEIDASGWGFSGQFDAAFSSIAEGEDTAFFGQSATHVRLWQVTIKDLSGLALDTNFQSELDQLNATYDPSTQEEFFTFLSKWGTHVISSALVGGDLIYCVTVDTSADYTKETAKAHMSFEYDAVFVDTSGSASGDWSRMGSKWLASRQGTLQATGGTPDVFGAFTPPENFDQDPRPSFNQTYVNWMNSVAGVPGIIGANLQPISHLAPLKKVDALNAALADYLNASAGGGVSVSSAGGWPSATSCVVTVGTSNVPPQNPQTSAVQPMCWIVMADDRGNVVFNENVLSDDPNDFDKIITAAEQASTGKTYWTVAVIYATTGVLTPTALQWFASWGVSVSPDWPQYPSAPHLLAAVGQSNSSSYQPAVETWIPSYDEWADPLTVQVQVPLYAGGSLL
jgi:hypothetical protein